MKPQTTRVLRILSGIPIVAVALLIVAGLVLLSGCARTPVAEPFDYEDAHGAIWRCDGVTPGPCELLKAAPVSEDETPRAGLVET